MTTAEEHLNFLNELVKHALSKGADAADAICTDGISQSVSCRLGKIEHLERAEGTDFGLRVLIGKKQAIVSSSDSSKKSTDELVERAVAMAKNVPEDPYCGLAEPSQLISDIKQLDMFDPSEFETKDLKNAVIALEESAMSVKGITNSEGADASHGQSKIAIAASNGFSCTYMRSSCSLSTAVLAENSNGMERDYDFASKVYISDLPDIKELGRKAGIRAVKRLNARKIKSTQVPIIFEPRVARGLISHFSSAINGAAVARGTTFLKDMLGKEVFHKNISILEDPHRPRGLRSKPCDAEGIANKKRKIIDNGVLTTWLLDLRSAKKLNMETTGHAARSIGSAPSPSATNLHIEAGEISQKEMIKEIKNGLYVTELFGHGTRIITGDYSRGAVGFWIENGEITYPVSEVTIAGNLKDMFKNITAASDLELLYGFNSPTLRIDKMTIAGS